MDHEALRQLRHDVRSPLMVISGFARLLGGDRPVSDEERKDFARRIETACQDLQKTIDSALE